MTSTLNVYTTPPQQERKAAKEAREAGFKSYVPIESVQARDHSGRFGKGKRRVPTARGYVFAEGKPFDAKHIRTNKGAADRREVFRLYVRSSATQIRHAFKPGDDVSIKRGKYASVPGVVAEIYRGCWYDVRVVMLGKSHLAKLKESDLVRLHPGTK